MRKHKILDSLLGMKPNNASDMSNNIVAVTV